MLNSSASKSNRLNSWFLWLIVIILWIPYFLLIPISNYSGLYLVGWILCTLFIILYSRNISIINCLLFGIAFIWTGSSLIGTSSTSVHAVDDRAMFVPTASTNLFWRLFPNEIEQRDLCQYTLLGWEKDTLHYEKSCGDAEAKVWKFTPNQDNQAKPILSTTIVTEPLNIELLPHKQVLEYVVAHGIYPRDEEYSVRSAYVMGDGMLSEDGKWVAAISRYLYEPQDVIVIDRD